MLRSKMPFSNVTGIFNRKLIRALLVAIGTVFVLLLIIKGQYPMEEKRIIKPKKPLLADVQNERTEIIGMMRHAWNAYEKYAFGYDHLRPITKDGQEWFALGISILDAVDTAYIMGQMDIYHKCRDWIKDSFKMDPENYAISVFEANIRVVGGFLSTFALTNDRLFLEKAKETADELLKYFHPNSGIPYRLMRLDKEKLDKFTTVADAGSLSLTFKYLSFLTNDPKYWNAVMRISKIFAPNVLKYGILRINVATATGQLSGPENIGAGADSFYEYLAKQYIQTRKVENGFPPQWQAYMKKVRESLRISSKNQFMFVDGGSGSSCHLDCFLGGTVALYANQGAKNGGSQKLTMQQLQDIDLAEELTRGCYELYHQTKTHLSPETVHWNVHQGESHVLEHHKRPVDNDKLLPYSEYAGTVSRHPPINISTSGDFRITDSQYHHRPETLESLFYLYRITGKQQYRDMGWQIFLAYQKHLKLSDSGYVGLRDVDNLESDPIDLMESFLFGESIKYLYLLFCDESVIPLDKFVFNTEAHPLPIFSVTPEFRKLVDWM